MENHLQMVHFPVRYVKLPEGNQRQKWRSKDAAAYQRQNYSEASPLNYRSSNNGPGASLRQKLGE